MKKIFIVLILSVLASIMFAQVSMNPDDPFYKDAKTWEVKGLTGWLPQIRPYSISTVKKILSDVKAKGSEDDVKLAEYYEQKYFSKGWNIGFALGNRLIASNDGDKMQDYPYANPSFYGDLSLLKYVGFGYDLGIVSDLKSKNYNDFLAFGETNPFDTYNDPFTFASITNNLDINANLTVGTENIYGMFGLNRIAFGPFLNDSVLLNGGQFHTGNFSFVYEGEKWGYTQIYSVLSRSTKNDILGGNEFAPEKYMGFHSIRFTPNKYISFSYFEASVYTDRFDPSYFLPIPYMIIQGMYAACDNTISGIVIDVKPVDNFQASTSFVIDDIDTDGFAKLDFNSRLRFACIIGMTYIPKVSFIDDINFNYTLVTPYTYSHNDPQTKSTFDKVKCYNQDNFTTRLTSLGTKLPPNSDRFYYSMTFRPVERLKVDCALAFARHANIAESFRDEEAQSFIDLNNAIESDNDLKNQGYSFSTDGSIWTSTFRFEGTEFEDYDYSHNRCNFLVQDHKMYILQCAVNAEYEFPPFKWGKLSVDAGYMFEFIANKGVDEHIYTKNSTDPASAKELWVANFRNVINNYFSITVKYCY